MKLFGWSSVFMVVLWVPLLRAEVPCMPLEQGMAEIMGERYKEMPLPMEFSLAGRPLPMRMFANAATGTWTMAVFPEGKICLLMAGDHWHFVAPPKKGDKGS